MAAPGVLDQSLAVLAVERVEGQADAGRHEYLLAGDAEGLAQRFEQPARDLGRIVVMRQLDDEKAELVAIQARDRLDGFDAGAGDRVLMAQQVAPPHHAREPARHCDQQLIAGLVPERVVDALELVEVQRQHTELAMVAPGVRRGPAGAAP